MNDDLQQLLLTFPTPIPQEGAVLHLEFTYTISLGLYGFYLSTYTGDGLPCGSPVLAASTRGHPVCMARAA